MKLLKLVETSLDDDKALDVTVIDLNGKTDFADYMVVAGGASSRQIGAMTDHLSQRVKADGGVIISVEGVARCDWVLIDCGDVIVHLFRPEVREFYGLEKLWGAPRPRAAAGMTA